MDVLKNALQTVVAGGDLTRDEAREVMGVFMSGEAGQASVGALLAALRLKGETTQEIAGMAQGMREAAVTITPAVDNLTDTCGTGGDRSGTFNISTTAAFIACGAGLAIAKHGNRSVSSDCGSADVLEELGVCIEMEPDSVRECIEQVGMGFLFAPRFHPAMRHVMPVRRDLGIPTVFNYLGPLANPAGAGRQLLGVSGAGMADRLAAVLAELGCERALVVQGCDGLDEATLSGTTTVRRVEEGRVASFELDPRELGLEPAGSAALRGAGPERNAAITREVLAGVAGPQRDVACLNAALALLAGGLAESVQDGLGMARESIDSGVAAGKLQELCRFTQEAPA